MKVVTLLLLVACVAAASAGYISSGWAPKKVIYTGWSPSYSGWSKSGWKSSGWPSPWKSSGWSSGWAPSSGWKSGWTPSYKKVWVPSSGWESSYKSSGWDDGWW